jgi:hypothetical protein
MGLMVQEVSAVSHEYSRQGFVAWESKRQILFCLLPLVMQGSGCWNDRAVATAV